VGAGAVALGGMLAGCRGPSSPSAPAIDWTEWWGRQETTGSLTFANWPYYIDRAQGNVHPSLDLFTQSTGIQVEYRRPIRGNATFLEKIRPALEAGEPTGYDLIVVTNGPQLSTLLDSGWVVPLDHVSLEQFDANAGPLVTDPAWDPGNRYTVAWQSGLTGIGYRPEAVEALGRDPTSVHDLWDPSLAGRVGMFTDEMDLGSFGLLAVDADPERSNEYDWSRAALELRRQQSSGVLRGYYDQGYLHALQRGDIWISQAWSGDIFQANQLGHPELRFALPDEGAMFWTDNMMIPAGAAHPRDAMTYIDFVYQPHVAAMIADWVWYVSPVPAAASIIRDRFDDPAVADSHLVFPPDVAFDGSSSALGSGGSDPSSGIGEFRDYYVFRSEEEIAAWRRTFGGIMDPRFVFTSD
jgi:spermidine/putrescine transport system substrate-binding protein